MSEERFKMRRVLTGLQVALLMLLAPVISYASDLDIAKKALRDNLWEIARIRAEKNDSVESKIVILESYAREGKWNEILKLLDLWIVPNDDAFVFYRFLAKAKSNNTFDIDEVLSKYNFSNSAYVKSIAGLCVQMSLDNGDAVNARKLVDVYSLDKAGFDEKTVAAAAYKASGDDVTANRLWREVVSSTNASSKAYMLSAWNLGDADILSNAYFRVAESVELKRLMGLKYGTALLKSPKTFENGRNLILALVNDSPGTDGARESMIYLASECLKNNDLESSAKYFKNAIEVWPEAASDFLVNELYGWSLFKLGRLNDALLSFSRAEEFATNDADKARVILKQAEILSSIGREEESKEKYDIVKNKYPETPEGKKLIRILTLRDMELRGRQLYKNFNFNEAYDLFVEIAKLDPERKARMDYLQMLCMYGQGKDDMASTKANELSLKCEDLAIRAEATLWLAKFYYNSQRWADSCALFGNYATNMVSGSTQASSALLWSARAAFASNNLRKTIDIITRLATEYPNSVEKSVGYVLQGEALIELSRFDEAILIFKTAVDDPKITSAERFRARMLLADALYIMGADNPIRYDEALEAYKTIHQSENIDLGQKINVAFKIARTLEKLNQLDVALDQYYGEVVCAYRDARARKEVFNEEVKSNFARAVFRLAEIYESRGQDEKAKKVLRLLIRSDVKASIDEARRRLQRIKNKGSF